MYDTVPPDRTAPKSPSEPSLSSSLSPTSSRESSPDLKPFSAATSSSGIELACGTPDSGRQDYHGHSLVMEHHNRSFDSPNQLGNRNNRTITEQVTSSSNPRTSGFYNSPSLPPAPFSAHNRNLVFRGNNSAAQFPDRNLSSGSWRNTNLATSQQNNRAYFYNGNDLIPPSYNFNPRQLPDTARNMSSPTSAQTEAASSTQQGGMEQENTGNDAGSKTNTGVGGGQSDAGTLALVRATKALTVSTNQQLQVAARSGQTDMPCYAYCFDRGNGQYTRLIPADMLPPLVDIPAFQQGYLGMTVLPCPTGLAPNGRSSNLERVFVQPTQQFPSGQIRSGNPRDPVQSRIDTIIASSPAPPVVETVKRQKIYCDKWIHEGVCAFTQQGCKYKHEMPLDKDTQESLGLFQGLPVWWRKHQGEITSDVQQIADVPGPSSSMAPGGGGGRPRGYSSNNAGRSGGGGGGNGGFGGANRLRQHTWRSHGPPVPGRGPSLSVSSGSGGGGSGNGGGQGRHQQVAQFSSPFGPIAPPSAATSRTFEVAQATRNAPVDNNFFNVLRFDQGNDESEEGAKLG